MRKPGFLPGFFSHCIQYSGLGKTTRHADVVDSSMDVMFGGLTRFLALAGPERFGWGGNPRDRLSPIAQLTCIKPRRRWAPGAWAVQRYRSYGRNFGSGSI